MMKRHAIQFIGGGVLLFLVAGGTGADRSWAANGQAVVVPPPEPTTIRSRAADGQAVVVPPPAPAAVSSGGPKATTPPAAVGPAIPAAKTVPTASSAPAAVTGGAGSLLPLSGGRQGGSVCSVHRTGSGREEKEGRGAEEKREGGREKRARLTAPAGGYRAVSPRRDRR